ncbi:hypothetical protein PN36_27345 [Candidatus Thiomargarita nelsonii]|uniref:PEP-utilising enzyme mobile domain-containing protein n=1 Tax=Candidatus Thiomargarita nelsonii TaxID=1003181 RepID=A0A0A6PQ17_9GAMM|nr:hypothetical protein PN36_27345 [Candidatus Thiomargarita nelsonii]
MRVFRSAQSEVVSRALGIKYNIMDKYIYFSDNQFLHSLNAKRLGLDHKLYTIDNLEQLKNTVTERSYLYLFSDFLLLDNAITSSKQIATDESVEVFVVANSHNDDSVRQAVKSLLNIDIDVAYGVVYIKINLSRIGNFDGSNKHNYSLKTLSGGCLQLDDHQVPRAALSTKAKTLGFFEHLIEAEIDSGVVISYQDWQDNRQSCVDRVLNQNWYRVITRSSSLNEDSFSSSNAGAFESVANIIGEDSDSIGEAIDSVFASYSNVASKDEVLLQRQITNVAVSGVCTTRVIGKGSPYYVICYDDLSGRTDSITAGDTNHVKTLMVYRNADLTELNIDDDIKKLLGHVNEIETITASVALDIEFIIDTNGSIHIVQIRPLVGDYDTIDDDAIDHHIKSSQRLFSQFSVPDDGITTGNKNIFGVMPDANPAELIGIKPRPLAFSLYQRLITDEIVTEQRSEYGYRDVRPLHHMLKFGGTPFINVRSSFNSFTPASLNDNLANKLINLYIDRLMALPKLHDKVEFDVVATTWFPGVGTWFDEIYADKLNSNEIKQTIDSLKQVCLAAIANVNTYINCVDDYVGKFDRVVQSDLSNINKGIMLIDICRSHGCKPFAHLARSGFIAISILKGFVNCNVMTKQQYDNYLLNIDSVSSNMGRDAYDVANGKLSKQAFYDRYGHLRPGTYDICSEAYFDNPEKYLDPIIKASKVSEKSDEVLDVATIANIDAFFHEENINLNFSYFDAFARKAIHGREEAKFKYTKFMSHGLLFLRKWAESLELTADDISYLLITDILDIASGNMPDNREQVLQMICYRKDIYRLESKIELPDLIKSDDDFLFFHKKEGAPNFISSKSVQAEIVLVQPAETNDADYFRGKVVLIDSADPGYDWLFGFSISGLITKYGGANSHMAIRCAELGIPAAIGVGDIIYNKLAGSNEVTLDCNNGIINTTVRLKK